MRKSQAPSFTDQSTLWPEASLDLAKMSPAPGRVPGSEEHAPVSGAKWRGSLPSVVRRGSSLRTSLLCALEELTGYSLTWKRSVTTHGRWWWVLGRSARRTEETGSGSLENWSTPDTQAGERDGTKRRAPTHKTISPRHGEGLHHQIARHWPTPTEGDGKASGSRIGNPNTKAHPGVSLTDATARAWPTPSATPYGSSNNGNPHDHRTEYATKGKPSLEGFARQWPTPQAQDEKQNGMRPHSDAKMLISEVLSAGPPDPANGSTSGKPSGSLNSRWVAQLQGYPAHWCDLPDEQIARLSARTATASSPPVSKRSAGQS